MDISEIRVKLVKNTKERLKAVCSVTFDSEFVIRDLKVIEGTSGLFVAMPSRKLADHCPKCRTKNHLRARFCNECGQKLDDRRADRYRGERARLHADIAHPINSECRSRIQARVVEAYEDERERSKEPGYRPIEDEDSVADSGSEYADLVSDLKKQAHERHARRSDRGEHGTPASDTIEASGDGFDASREQQAQEPLAEPSVHENDDFASKGEDESEPSEASVKSAPHTAPSPPTEDDGFGAGIL